MPEPTEQSFLKDVANHEMTVLLDNGLYRHLRFKQKEHSWNAWFGIVTWPGYLAFYGDMGCFVFNRIEDMFAFFRTRPSNCPEELHINRRYWSEKLDAVDRDVGATQFSPEVFRSKVEEHFEEWVKEQGLSKIEIVEFKEELDSMIFCRADDGEDAAREALSNFEHTIDGHPLKFHDTWEWDFSVYTYRFTWCCYALVWAIKKYDEVKSGTERGVECSSSAH